MKRTFLLTILATSVMLSGCGSTSPTPVQLARKFVKCNQPYGNAPAYCARYQTEFDEIRVSLASLPNRQNLGQQIIDTQTQLVTLQQEFAKKTVSDSERQAKQAAIEATQRKVLVLRSVFLLGAAQ